MRVARLIEMAPPAPGGMQVHAVELSRGLARAGIDQHVFVRVGDAIDPNVGLTRVPPPRTMRLHPLAAWCVAAARAIARQHAQRRFDVIHAHGDMLEAAVAARLAVALNIPAVLTIHGGLSDSVVHNRLRLAAFSAMQTVIAVSEAIASQLRDIGVSSEIIVRPSGVRAEMFAVAEGRSVRRHSQPARALAVARFHPMKGLETLVAGADELAHAGVMLTVVGSGEGAYADGIRAQLTDRSNVELIHTANAAGIARLLESSDVFILSSRTLPGTAEGTPTVLMEALAAGVPIVATDTGGVRALLRGGVDGEVVAPDDPKALATAVRRVLAAPEEAQARADRARAAGTAVPWSTVADTVAGVYASALARHQRTAALLTLPQLDVGGAERFIIDRATQIREAGHRVGLAAAPGAMSATVADGVEQVPLARRGRPGADVDVLLALAGAQARLRPVVVDSHHLPTGLLAVAGARLAGTRSRHVMTVHIPERPWSEPVIALAGVVCFDRVLVVAEDVAERLRRAVPARFVDRFVLTRAAVREPAPVVMRPRTVAIVGRLVERKGHAVALRAWPIVSAQAPGWTLEIWGDGPERDAVERAAAMLHGVQMCGEVPGASMRLGELELLIVPSLREGLPLVVAEAMAAGVPVIASDLPGIRELVGDDSGVLVPPGDAVALGAAISRLIGEPALRRELAERGRVRVRAQHDPETVAARTLAILGLSSA